MTNEKIVKIISNKLKNLGVPKPTVELSHPRFSTMGTVSTNVAFQYAKSLKSTPNALATIIKEDLEKNNPGTIEFVKVDSGFINIEISPRELYSEVESQKSPSKESSRILLEYGQPNTHKTPHIGHLFSYIFGESLSRILEYQGNKVTRLNYQGDIGLHVAKCLWGITNTYLEEYKKKPLKDRVIFLQKSYQEGSLAYEKDKKAEKEIDELNYKIYLREKNLEPLWSETRQWCIEFYREFEKRLGISYEKYYFESETGPVGKNIVKENVGKIFEERW